jgi:hypothetical protein
MNDTLQVTRLLTRRNALEQSRIDIASQQRALPDGEAWLAVDRVALTTNNITYAAFGEAMQYWNFFPTGEADWGHMPAWGFADVVASTVQGVTVGERFYGYFPLASHLRMQPVRVTPRGFYDGFAHRQSLTSAYNQYARCSDDPVYAKADENHQILLRPLFITSFMLADFLGDNGYFGAKRLLVSSASSKTAFGTAFCLEGAADVESVALTSPRNRGFVEGLNCYQRTVSYDELETLDTATPTLYVDFSGDDTLRARVHAHFGNALVYDCFAGSAQKAQAPDHPALPGPAPVFYFAPVQIRKRNADWGPAVVNQRFGDAQRRFIHHVSDPANHWMRVVEHHGFESARRLIADLHAGKTAPVEGHVARLV